MTKAIIGLYVLLTSAGLIFMKLGSEHGPPLSLAEGRLHSNLNAAVITGLLLYAVSFVVYVYLISKFDLGYIIPLLAGFVYLLVFSASYFVFKEAFTITKTLGICFILFGLMLINVKTGTS